MDKEYKFYQYPRGVNKGGVLDVDICPTISCSSWENNCFLIEIDMNKRLTICMNSKVDGKQPSLEHRVYDSEGIATAVTTGFHPSIAEPLPCAMRGRNPDNPSERKCSNGRYKQRIEVSPNNDMNTITSVQKDSLVLEPLPHADVKYRIRKLTPRECFRLMGVDDADIDKIQAAGISNSQQYKMAGNSIVVDTIAHILRKLYIDKGKKQAKQLTLF